MLNHSVAESSSAHGLVKAFLTHFVLMSSEMIFIDLHDFLGWYVIIGSIAELIHFNKITTMESIGEGWDFKLSKPLFVGKEA